MHPTLEHAIAQTRADDFLANAALNAAELDRPTRSRRRWQRYFADARSADQQQLRRTHRGARRA